MIMSAAIEKSRTAAAKRIFKVIEHENKNRKIQHATGFWWHDGGQYIVNGYVGIATAQGCDIQDIPQNENNEEALPTIYDILDNAAKHCTMEITQFVPPVAEIKVYEKYVRSKTNKYRGKFGIPMFIGDDLVNTYHLLSVIQTLPNSRVFVNPKSLLRPLYFISDYGWGVLLPIRPLFEKDGESEYYKANPFVNKPIHPKIAFNENKEWKRYE